MSTAMSMHILMFMQHEHEHGLEHERKDLLYRFECAVRLYFLQCISNQIKSNQIYLLRVLTVLNQYNHELIVNVAAEEFNPRFDIQTLMHKC
jgi:hypothetical protein